MIDQAYQRAREVLTNNKEKLDRIAGRLMEVETLEEEEFEALVGAPA
ncbi:MAG: hypothetical protein U9Q78_03415 [Chloroflexota bacterium]|nr:hypothetical protein [Chloroflexota bacterium]